MKREVRSASLLTKAYKIRDYDRRKLLEHAAIDAHLHRCDNSTDLEELRPAVEAIAQFIVHAARMAAAQASGVNVIHPPERRANLCDAFRHRRAPAAATSTPGQLAPGSRC